MPYLPSDCSCNTPNTLHCSNIKQNCVPIQCKRCGDKTEDDEARQKRIWKACRVPSSLYTMNLASLTVNKIDRSNVNTKHSSYAKYLAIKNANNIIASKPVSHPKQGNKVQSYELISKNRQCACN